MALDLRTAPYYDDFNTEKNFHRILFKPGYAVQARELTQIQTVLQDQLQRFGNHIFKEGSVVLGCPETFKFNVPFVKINTFNNLGIRISDEVFNDYKTSLLGKIVYNELGVRAEIIHVDTSPSGQRVLYLNYTSASTADTQPGNATFSNTEEVLSVEGVAVKFLSITDGIGEGSLFTLGEGIVYAKGYFIRSEETTVVIDHFSSTPSKKVGFRVLEEYVTSDDDVTLLDPAAGSYNYAAPGADRYRLQTEILVYNIEQDPDVNFFLLFEVSEGKVKRVYNKPQYAELQKVLAQRTFDESGNYTVHGLNVNIREHLKTDTNNGKYIEAQGGDLSKLVYGVEPGKAYVEGYDIELGATEYLAIDKALDTAEVTEKAISTTFGNYVLVNLVRGNWNIYKNIKVNLKNGSTTITTARVRLVEWDSGTGPNAKHRLYLYDFDPSLNLSTVNTIESIETDPLFGTHLAQIPSGDTFTLRSRQYGTMLFPTSYRGIESYIDDTDFYFWKSIESININPTGSGFIGTASLPLNEVWAFNTTGTVGATEKLENFLVTLNSTGANITENVTISVVNDSTVEIQYSSAVSVRLLAKVRSTNSDPIVKTIERTYLKVNNTASFTGESAFNWNNNKRLYLGISDAVDIEAIYRNDPSIPFENTESNYSAWENLTEDFQLFTNQNDNYYNTSYIQYRGSGSPPAGRYLIKFRYFKRDTYNAGYMNKNSYQNVLIDADPLNPVTASTLTIYTYQIPVFTSEITGISYDLRDAIDFRPAILSRNGYENRGLINAAIVANTDNVPNSEMQTNITVPAPDEQLITSFNYYLPRTDKVILTRDGVFGVIRGDESQDIPHMVLANVYLAPYPSLSNFVAKQVGREDYSSTVRLIDNRRYTMRDIGDIEQRVSRLEYFASLSMIESKAANIPLFDNAGDALIKRGILVDAFDGHSVANVFSTEYSAAIDTQNKVLRPSFEMDNIEFEPSGTFTKTGDVITTSKLSDKILIQNIFASKERNCGNTILTNYQNGLLHLNPQQDIWLDETSRPDVQSNFQGNNDSWEFSPVPFKHHWNSWRGLWQGIEHTSERNSEVTIVNGITGVRVFNETAKFVSDITKSMVISKQLPDANIRMMGNRVFDISIVPFIRSQVISFIARGLKPNSLVQAFFDQEEVTEYCRYFTLPNGVTVDDIQDLSNPILLSQYEPTASLYNPTGGLKVSNDGTLVGQFKIEAGRYRSGNRIFRLADSAQSTMATAQYQAIGIPNFNDSVITSTRIAEVRQDVLSETQNTIIGRLTLSNPSSWSPTSYGDPLAQTFIVEGETDGVMITKVDVYFSKISSTKGVAVQIREVVNGFPGNRIVPFSTKYLPAGHTNIKSSSNATLATTFTFESPVYLKNNVEYALVILPENNTTDYAVWVSELGQNKLGTTERITQQPYIGVLFIPNNNTSWSALEAEDLKFALYKGEFGNTSTVKFKNAPIDYLTIEKVSGSTDLVPGDVIKVFNPAFIQKLTTTTAGLDPKVTVSGKNITGVNTAFDNGELEPGDILRVAITGQELTNSTVIPTMTVTAGSTAISSTTEIFQHFKVGDIINRNDILGTIVGKIASITNNTQAVLEAPYTGASETSLIFGVFAILGEVANITTGTSIILRDSYRSVLTSSNTIYKDIIIGKGYVSHIKNSIVHTYVTHGSFAVGNKFSITTTHPDLSQTITQYAITDIVSPTITGFMPNFGTLVLNPINNITWKYQVKTELGVQTTPKMLRNGESVEFETPFVMHSYSSTYGEKNTGKSSVEIEATMITENSSVSPVIDTQKMMGLTLLNNIDITPNTSKATYITRTVTLDDNNDDPDDLRVFVDMKKPENTSIKVYVKLNDDPWVLMTETPPRVQNTLDYQEYMYNLPAIKIYNKFAIKIEMFSGTTIYTHNPCKVPMIKNFRAIALI